MLAELLATPGLRVQVQVQVQPELLFLRGLLELPGLVLVS